MYYCMSHWCVRLSAKRKSGHIWWVNSLNGITVCVFRRHLQGESDWLAPVHHWCPQDPSSGLLILDYNRFLHNAVSPPLSNCLDLWHAPVVAQRSEQCRGSTGTHGRSSCLCTWLRKVLIAKYFNVVHENRKSQLYSTRIIITVLTSKS